MAVIQPKIYALTLTVLALAGLGYFGPFNPPSAEVLIIDEGFQPDYLKIVLGTKVVFKNIGGSPHWPASNLHPTHRLYPEEGGCLGSLLDACKGLEPGETYAFTFKRVGKWAMHDHIYPGLIMVVEVVEKNDQSFGTSSEESSLFLNLSYADQLTKIRNLGKSDPAGAWNLLKEVFLADGEVPANVHELAHLVGNALYDKFGLEGIKYCDDAFSFGCFHGVIEVLPEREGQTSVSEVEETCLEVFPDSESINYTGCFHGLGHGLLTFRDFDLNQALADCDNLAEQNRPYCYDGVFMENATGSEGLKFNANNPWGLCLSVSESYHLGCARYQSLIFFNQYKDFTKVGQACGKTEKELFLRTCFETLGFYAAQTHIGNFEGIVGDCGLIADPTGRNLCLIGASRESIFQQYTGWPEVSQRLCASVEADWNSECLASNATVKRIYNR